MKREGISAFVIPSEVEESLSILPNMIRDVSVRAGLAYSLDMTELSGAQDVS